MNILNVVVPIRNACLKTSIDTLIDNLGNFIKWYVKKYRDELTFEEIIHTLTGLGEAPSLLYDDNGNYALGYTGSQNMLDPETFTEETMFEGQWIIPPNGWKKSIREALNDYLDRKES